jgi:hypothetical protein
MDPSFRETWTTLQSIHSGITHTPDKGHEPLFSCGCARFGCNVRMPECHRLSRGAMRSMAASVRSAVLKWDGITGVICVEEAQEAGRLWYAATPAH